MGRWLAACGWASVARRAILQDRGQRHRLRPAGGQQPGLARSRLAGSALQAEWRFPRTPCYRPVATLTTRLPLPVFGEH